MKAVCQCEPCRSRRAAQNRWFENNKTHRLAYNRAWRKGEPLPEKPLVCSDDELDRKALATMPWRR